MLLVKLIITYALGVYLGWVIRGIARDNRISKAYTDGLIDGLELKQRGDEMGDDE